MYEHHKTQDDYVQRPRSYSRVRSHAEWDKNCASYVTPGTLCQVTRLSINFTLAQYAH